MQAIKFFAIFFFIMTYMAAAAVIWALPFLNSWKKRKICTLIHSRYCRLGLFILNVNVSVIRHPHLLNSEYSEAEGSFLMVGNHLSYMDILIIAAFKPTCFVTSKEIRETPFLGILCQLAGCLFVERRNKTNLLNEVQEITEALRQGLNVVVFPEATSTNGEHILRFRKPLFAAAIASGAAVFPFCLNYKAINEVEVTVLNRDLLFWYGDMSFAPHLWDFSGLKNIQVDLELLTPIGTQAQSLPEELAAQAQHQVEATFRPVVALKQSESL